MPGGWSSDGEYTGVGHYNKKGEIVDPGFGKSWQRGLTDEQVAEVEAEEAEERHEKWANRAALGATAIGLFAAATPKTRRKIGKGVLIAALVLFALVFIGFMVL